MTLLYITYIDFGEMGSGSSVRPQRMYDAFQALGLEIKLVSGLQNRRAQRRQTVRQTLLWLKDHRPDFCYIEPPSCPIYLQEDHALIRRVHRMGIPTAVFYRDAHWLYADWWGVSGVKAAALRMMHRRDLRLFRQCCDRVYFPSGSMAALFENTSFRATGILPPGCLSAVPAHTELYHCMIYVGGINRAYGTDLLLEAFRLLQAEGFPVELILCCREKEMANLPEESFNQPHLQVIHASGDGLTPYYRQCDAGLLPLRRDRYMDFALPVKLFEYWGGGLPVIATDCPEIAGMVNRYHAGTVCDASARGLANAIRDFYNKPLGAAAMMQNVHNAAGHNRWIDRAQQIVDELCGEGRKP